MLEDLKRTIQDFLKFLTKLLIGLALVCKWISDMTLAGY
jgi:hypothetical protein